MSETKCKAIKSRNSDHTEALVYIRFSEPPTHDSLLMAFASILNEKIPWSKPDTTKTLLAFEGLEKDGPLNS